VAETGTDHYTELMRDSRGLSASALSLRESWFAALELPKKQEQLFELEMLLKGVVCFADVANHPGAGRDDPPESRECSTELRVILNAFERIADLAGQLNEAGGTVPPRSNATVGRPLVHLPHPSEGPGPAMRVLGRSFTSLADVVGAMVRLKRVPYRAFAGVVDMVQRQVAESIYFDPLRELEFCQEYDQFQHVEILHIIYGGAPEGAQRASALAFLSLFRILNCVRLTREYLADPTSASLAVLPLAVVRSDGRAISAFMAGRARRWLCRGFEQEVMALSARQVVAASAALEEKYRVLHDLRAMLQSVGDQLSLQFQRSFEQLLPPLSELMGHEEFVQIVTAALDELTDLLLLAVSELVQVFKPELQGAQIFSPFVDEAVLHERRRREIWMFSQIIRGFLAKTVATPETINRWTGQSSYRFVREFARHFRCLGFHLLRALHYDHFQQFRRYVEALSAASVLDQVSVEDFAQECQRAQEFLTAAFDEMSGAPALSEVPFDRHDAIANLRLYLDRSQARTA
jgi:hypothetical protein